MLPEQVVALLRELATKLETGQPLDPGRETYVLVCRLAASDLADQG